MQVASGFAAIVPSERVAGRIAAVLDARGWVVAATVDGELIGYASVLPPRPVKYRGETFEQRWDDMNGVLELGALEVARPYRRSGIGRAIAAELGADPRLDEVVTYGRGVVHHWDLGWSGLTAFAHRAALAGTLRRAGMFACPTDDPENPIPLREHALRAARRARLRRSARGVRRAAVRMARVNDAVEHPHREQTCHPDPPARISPPGPPRLQGPGPPRAA